MEPPKKKKQIAKVLLKIRNDAVGITIFNFKLNYRAILIKYSLVLV